MRTFRVEGIVLKRQNVGEADRILTILTREFGKIHIKAKGVRKITSKRSSHIEPLNVCNFSLYKGHALPVLTEVVTMEHFSSLKDNLEKIGFAYHLCELIDGLCPVNEENEKVFSLLLDVLKKMQQQNILAPLIHEFEVALLTALGYWSAGRQLQNTNVSYLIEDILERKLKTRQLLPRLV